MSSVVLAPFTSALAVSDSAQLTARVAMSDGSSAVNQTVVWTTSDATVATISSSGMLRGVSAGTATITAAAAGAPSVTASATLTVRQLLATTVRITTTVTTLGLGRSLQVRVASFDSAGRSIVRPIMWRSDNAGVGVIDTSGILLARQAGVATVFATVDGVTASSAFTVFTADDLIFSTGNGGASHIATAFADGVGMSLIKSVQNASYSFAPVWSPNGRTLAFITYQDQPVIQMMALGSSAVKTFAATKPVWLNAPISWSSEGGMAYSTSSPNGGVFVLDTTTGAVRRIAANGYDAIWSPDGRTLAYGTAQGSYAIRRAEAKDSSDALVVSGMTRLPRFCWAPDHAQIYFASDSVLYAVAVTAGAVPRRIAELPGPPLSLVCSLTGRIAYSSFNTTTLSNEVYLVDADGRFTKLPLAPASYGTPEWSADGLRLFLPRYALGISSLLSIDEKGAATVLLQSSTDGFSWLRWNPAHR